MPEGDTLHRAAAALAPLLVGQTLSAVYDRGLHRRRLDGQRVESVRAEGKHLMIAVSDQIVIHVHFGMHGRWVRLAPDEVARHRNRSNLVLVLDGFAVSFVRAPVIEFLRAAFVHAHPVLARLGPDLLDPDASLDEVLGRARAADQGRVLADILLDQRVASGIGNIYKSESLFAERVNPFAPLSAVDDDTLLRIYRRARAQLGANLGPGPRTTTADLSRGDRPPMGVGRYHVYRRSGRPCYRCRTLIAMRRVGDANRSTYFCPSCQSLPPADAPPRIRVY